MRHEYLVAGMAALALVAFQGCRNRNGVRTAGETAFESGTCAGCLFGEDDGLSSFIARTGKDYERMLERCGGIRKEYLPPGPGTGEVLVYVSREGSGCRGCLDIVDVRETEKETVVEVEGGFQGPCEMLITLGAWAIIPETGKPVVLRRSEVVCAVEQ